MRSRNGLRLAVFFALSTVLSGCLSLGDGAVTRQDNVMTRAALAGGEVIVVPPQGYCIQKDSLKSRRDGGFALVASCERLTGFVSGYQVPPVVMTISAVERDSTAPEPSAAEVSAGLGDRQVLRRLHGDGLTVVQVMDPAPLSVESDPKHWRGMMVINGHMVGLALYGAKGSAETGERGLTQLMWLAEQIREESPQRPRPATAFEVADVPADTGRKGAEPDQPRVQRTGLGAIRPVARPGTPGALQELPVDVTTEAPAAKDAEGGKAKPILRNIFGRIFS